MTKLRQRLCIDFDGVIHQYSKGWHTKDIYDPPMPGAFDALQRYWDRGYDLVIFSARSVADIEKWMTDQLRDTDYDFSYTVTNTKVPATVYLDDRAVRFYDWDQAIHDVDAALAAEAEWHQEANPRRWRAFSR